MKNKFFKALLSCLFIASLAVAVTASGNFIYPLSQDATQELSAVQTAVADSNLLRACFGSKTYINENDEIVNTAAGNADALMISENSSEICIPEKYNIDKSFKNYYAALSKKMTSIYDNCSADYNWITPIERDSKIVAFAYLNKGKPIDEVQKALESLKFNNAEDKEKILNVCSKREGKWYVAAIKKVNLIDDATFICDSDKISKYLGDEGVSNIQDIRHITLGDIRFICIKTLDNEYVIPFSSRPEQLKNGTLYTAREALNILNNNTNQ